MNIQMIIKMIMKNNEGIKRGWEEAEERRKKENEKEKNETQ